jgi:hypothetical protein
MRPYVPRPTERKKKRVQMLVTTKPIGKKARAVPGTTKGAARKTAEVAAAAAVGSALEGWLASAFWAKTPFTKRASLLERVVVTSAFVVGLRAARSI